MQALVLHRIASGQQQSAGAVVETGGIACGNGATFGEGRLHLRQLLKGHLRSHVLVDLELGYTLAGLDFHGDDLAIETSFGDGAGCPLLALQG
ncbi:hypothetical protein D3C78_1819900 [compost metagenome]